MAVSSLLDTREGQDLWNISYYWGGGGIWANIRNFGVLKPFLVAFGYLSHKNVWGAFSRDRGVFTEINIVGRSNNGKNHSYVKNIIYLKLLLPVTHGYRLQTGIEQSPVGLTKLSDRGGCLIEVTLMFATLWPPF